MFPHKPAFLVLLLSLMAIHPLLAQSTDPIAVGTKVTITNVHPEDSYFEDKDEYIGKTGVVVKTLTLSSEGKGWYGGEIKLDGSSGSPYFYAVEVSLDNELPSERASVDNDLPDVITKGTRVTIVDVSPEDSYYDDKEYYIGQSGVANEDLELFDDGWYGGEIILDESDDDPYFYAVALKLGDLPVKERGAVKTSPKGETGASISKGTRVTIVDLSEADSYYSDIDDYVGKTGVVVEKLNRSGEGDGWFGGEIQLDGSDDSPYFYAVAVTIGDAPVKEKTAPTRQVTKGLTGATVAKGTKVVIVDLSPEDSYYSDKAKYVRQTGVVKETLNRSSEGDGWFGGSILLDNGGSPYFYAVAVAANEDKGSEKSEKAGKALRGETAAVIPKGSRVVIVDVNPEDSYYSDKDDHIGQEGIVLKSDLTQSSVGKGWYSGEIKMDSDSKLGSPYYYAVSVKIISK